MIALKAQIVARKTYEHGRPISHLDQGCYLYYLILRTIDELHYHDWLDHGVKLRWNLFCSRAYVAVSESAFEECRAIARGMAALLAEYKARHPGDRSLPGSYASNLLKESGLAFPRAI